MSNNKCKVEIPNQLPETGLTRVQFKTWKESLIVYLKQNDNFLPFLSGGIYESWKPAEEHENRILDLHADDAPDPNDATNRTAKLAKRQKDLLTMLNMIGRKVDQYDYDDVMNLSSSVQSIWNMIDLVYDIGRKGVHFLELSKIKYEAGESPAKFYKKIYHHFMDNLYKKNDTLAYKGTSSTEDEKLSPTLLNFILFYTIETIDTRLMKKIKDKWGHLLDSDTCLHDKKDTILKAIPDILKRLEAKEFEARALETQLSAFGGRGRFQGRARGRGSNQNGSSRPYQQQSSGLRPKCRLCQAAKCPERVYMSHSVANCNRWSRKDVEDLRVMMCDMETDPKDWPESDSDQD
jgi:hypothetical protein